MALLVAFILTLVSRGTPTFLRLHERYNRFGFTAIVVDVTLLRGSLIWQTAIRAWHQL